MFMILVGLDHAVDVVDLYEFVLGKKLLDCDGNLGELANQKLWGSIPSSGQESRDTRTDYSQT